MDCQTCQDFVTDLEKGEVKTYAATDPETGERRELPQVRPKGTPPPCQQCPKQSPEKAHLHELSEKNWRAFAHYRQAKAVGLTDAERSDPIVRRNFALIDALMSDHEAQRQARYLAEGLAAALFAGTRR